MSSGPDLPLQEVPLQEVPPEYGQRQEVPPEHGQRSERSCRIEKPRLRLRRGWTALG